MVPLFLAVSSLAVYAEGGAPLPQVKLKTSHGDIIIELNAEKAPNTVANFLSYVEENFYNGTIFHRVIKNFMIQGGGFTKDLTQKQPKGPIESEANNGLGNVRGSVAMARTDDPHSATSQFFINIGNNEFLDFRDKQGSVWEYTVFAKVIKGMKIVDIISNVITGSKGNNQDRPNSNVVIQNVIIIE